MNQNDQLSYIIPSILFFVIYSLWYIYFIYYNSRQYEVVRDPVEHSLNAEAKLISQIRVLLKDKCEAAWDKLATLEDIRQRLELDLQDKTTALAIDINQIELSERSGGISHKPEAIKCPNGYASDDMYINVYMLVIWY